MKILIVSATLFEIEPIIDFFEFKIQNNEKFFTKNLYSNKISFLITGIGSYSVIYQLTKLLVSEKYDLVINVGITGSFDKKLSPGQVVFVKTEKIGDLGIDKENCFIPLAHSNLVNFADAVIQNEIIFKTDNKYFEDFSEIKRVNSVTLNSVTASKSLKKKIKASFNAQIENMEGAAVAYVCAMEDVDFVEIRSISNYVGERDKEKWETLNAINNLNNFLKMYLLEMMK